MHRRSSSRYFELKRIGGGALALAALSFAGTSAFGQEGPRASDDPYDEVPAEPPPKPSKPAAKPATRKPAPPPATPPPAQKPAAKDRKPKLPEAPPEGSLRPKSPLFVAPRVMEKVTAPYPFRGQGEQVVVLEVTLDPKGKPVGIVARKGESPFLEAAIKAAKGFTYQPARRLGRAVVGTVVLRFPFHPSGPRESEAEANAATSPAAAPSGATPDAPQPAIEILVTGTTPPRGSPDARFGAREVEGLPGTFGEAFRAVELTPGVSGLASGLPVYFLRGAYPGAGAYLVDGIRVPQLFHVVAGPAVVNPALLEGLDVYSGAYPAELGRSVGGVVSATLREPKDRLHAEGFARLYDVGGLVESPLTEGVHAFAAGRISHTAPLLSALSEDFELFYADYQAGVSLDLTPHERLSVLALGSTDHLAEVDGEAVKPLFDASFHRLSLRLEHGPRGEPDRYPSARVSLTLGADETGLEYATVRSQSLTIAADATWPVSKQLVLRGGADFTGEQHGISPRGTGAEGPSETFLDGFPSRSAATLGGYVDASLALTRSVTATPGLRVDGFAEEGAGELALEPRLVLRVELAPSLVSVTRAGLVHERPRGFFVLPGLTPAGLSGGLESATQLSQAVELELPSDIRASLGAFHHSFDDLADIAATCSLEVDSCSLRARADGRAYGFEARLSRSFSRELGGLVAYTLSRTERTFQGQTFPSDFDRAHVFHAALGYRFAEGWSAGARVSAYSGRPYSLLRYDDPEHPEEPTLVGHRNALRREPFARLDLRLERRFRYGDTGWLAVVAEVLNATASREVVDVDCRASQLLGTTFGIACGGEEIGPVVLPSLGVMGGF